jgi:ketosteroid isomerase-like protein
MNGMPSDRIEIQELVHRYCDALCRRDREAWVATWAEDGVWNVGRGEVVGQDALSEAFLRIMELFEHVLQIIHNGEASVDGDVARGRWYITEYGLTAKGRRTFYIAHYDDAYLRTAHGWRFARRRATWHYHGEPDLTGVFGPPPGYA